MKKLLIASALSAAFASPAAFAQAKNFEGFNVQASTGYQHNEIDISGGDVTVNGISYPGFSGQDTKRGRMPLNLGIGYTFAINDKFTLGGLVEWNPLKMKTGSGNLTYNGTAISGAEYTGKLENQVAISIVPGYAFNEQTMGYVKLGWISAKAKLETDIGGGASISKRANGVLVGVGAKHLFSKNVYGFAEATYASYGSVKASYSDATGSLSTKLKPNSYSFLIGVGAQF